MDKIKYNNEFLRYIKKEIKEGYGDKCVDYNGACPSCILYKHLEHTTALIRELNADIIADLNEDIKGDN